MKDGKTQEDGAYTGAGVSTMMCWLKSCGKCQGDLVLDGDEWRCWQCGRYYYPKPQPVETPLDYLQLDPSRDKVGMMDNAQPRRQTRRSIININQVITAKKRADDRWWLKNQEIIRKLEEGRSVREISEAMGRGERQIRIVRERLNELQLCS